MKLWKQSELGLGIALAMLLAATPLWAARAGMPEVTVCVGNPGAADRWVVEEWRAELGRILAAAGRELRLTDCGEAGTIQVYFMRVHPEEMSALGAARTRGAAVLPLVEVYSEPLAALLGTRLSGVLGRAMARVTAHELVHFLRQQHGHDETGPQAAGYTAGLLMAARPAYFARR